MPIRINLMAEAQALEDARRRNPVKLGAWIAGFLVALVGLWIVKMQFDIHFAKNELANYNSQWKTAEEKYNGVVASEGKVASVNAKIAALDHLYTNRFLWGPLLNALQYAVVDQVQVTHFQGTQSAEREPNRNVANKIIFGSANLEKIRLTISGKDYTASGEGYKKFEDALNHSEYFIKKMGGRDGFTIDGTPGQKHSSGPGSTVEFRTFTLTNQLPDIRREDK